MALRGPYKKKGKEIIQDDIVDAIVARDTSFVPVLAVRDRVDDVAETSCVLVGHLKYESQAHVYMMPFVKQPKEGQNETIHLLKYYNFTHDGVKEPPFGDIEFDADIISMRPFMSIAGNSRWSDQPAKKTAHREWLLFVWECTTGENLPIEKTTSNSKRKTTEAAQAIQPNKRPRLTRSSSVFAVDSLPASTASSSGHTPAGSRTFDTTNRSGFDFSEWTRNMAEWQPTRQRERSTAEIEASCARLRAENKELKAHEEYLEAEEQADEGVEQAFEEFFRNRGVDQV